ncbi:hypothetical protein RB195_000920 [Necator americanus]|uniref:Reverse transcriptase domain-containing protein n=1 Tax=Necator americanus TaxID=51031 RepID=A0ABR1DD84_NECAM
MQGLEWDNMGVKVADRYLHHLRFADVMGLITSSISQVERILAEFDDEVCEKIGLQLNLGIYDQRNESTRPNVQLFISRGLGKSGYGLTFSTPPFFPPWPTLQQPERFEKVPRGFWFTQLKQKIRSSVLHHRSKTRVRVTYAKESKISWVRHEQRLLLNQSCKRLDTTRYSPQEDLRLDGPNFLRSLPRKNTMLFEKRSYKASEQMGVLLVINRQTTGAQLNTGIFTSVAVQPYLE